MSSQPPSEHILKMELLASHPTEWPVDVTSSILSKLSASRTKIVVVDDDPTGCQTVSDMALLTRWDVDSLISELNSDQRLFFILTNSRSVSGPDARQINRDVAINLAAASSRTKMDFVIISRGDSTLRGHFAIETEALFETATSVPDAILFIPFFAEGGRVTAEDVHYVQQGDYLIPVGETEFARDASFGFKSSNLYSWLAEQQPGSNRNHASISLKEIRLGGPDTIAHRLMNLQPGSICFVNALSIRDIEVFTDGVLTAESRGRRFLYRSSATFVPVRAGRPPCRPLPPSLFKSSGANGGLTIVGSYTKKTTEQLAQLLSSGLVSEVEAAAEVLTDTDKYNGIERIAAMIDEKLCTGSDVVLYTSRTPLLGESPAASLDIGRRISQGLAAIVRKLNCRPRYILAKGGITSHDIATGGLGTVRATVLGQIRPGIPVWRLGDETTFPGLLYIVFPGNVGEPPMLTDIVRSIRLVEPQPLTEPIRP